MKKKIKNYFYKRGAAAQLPIIIGLLLLGVALPAGLRLVQQQQELRREAASCETAWSCFPKTCQPPCENKCLPSQECEAQGTQLCACIEVDHEDVSEQPHEAGRSTPFFPEEVFIEGVTAYTDHNGRKEVLSISGLITEVHLQEYTVTVESKNEKIELQYEPGDIIYLNSLKSLVRGEEFEILDFSELKEGDIVNYNPKGEKFSKDYALWNITRNEP